MPKLMRLAASLCLALVAAACTGPVGPDPEVGPEEIPVQVKDVLFIGNSLTFYNDLPATVAAIAASAGDTFRTAASAEPNVALIDHLNGASDALARLSSQQWDYVVLQQGPTTTQIGRDSLVVWTEMFEPHIRTAGAEPALFMTWPQNADWSRMHLVRLAYQQAADTVNGVFLPAGEAWRLAHEADAGVEVYGPDQFHPSELGSYLAALTIYERLSGRDARTLPRTAYAGTRVLTTVSEATVGRMQAAAHAANLLYPAAGAASRAAR